MPHICFTSAVAYRVEPGHGEFCDLTKEAGMTAYLISLALAGLIAIAVCEVCA